MRSWGRYAAHGVVFALTGKKWLDSAWGNFRRAADNCYYVR